MLYLQERRRKTDVLLLVLERALSNLSNCSHIDFFSVLIRSSYQRVYCSPECQKRDWKEGAHKKECGKIQMIHGVLAPNADGCMQLKFKMWTWNVFTAISHRIINNPSPPLSQPETVPGSSDPEDRAIIIRLGPSITPQQYGSSAWWPTAMTTQIREKLYRRIACDGYDFHLHWIIAFSLMDVFYTKRSKFKLKYKSCPIADFGLAHGKFRVMPQDRLAYVLPDGSVRRSQDPNDHWWIYLTTMKGEELILDFGAYVWNLGTCVKPDPYDFKPLGMAPALFRNRELSKVPNIEEQFVEHERFSVLKDPELQSVIHDFDTIWEGMPTCFEYAKSKLKRELSAFEKEIIPEWIRYVFCG